MKKVMRNLGITGVLMILVLGLCACGGKEDDFDAAAYTKAILDTQYHGEHAEYAKLVDISEKEAEADREEMLNSGVEAEFGSEDGITEEQKAKLKDMMSEVYKNTKYEVGKAKKTDDGFDVEVKIQPNQAMAAFEEGLEAKTQEAAESGTITDESQAWDFIIDYLNECVTNAAFGDETSITVKVTQDSDDVWQITEDEMEKIESAMIAQ